VQYNRILANWPDSGKLPRFRPVSSESGHLCWIPAQYNWILANTIGIPYSTTRFRHWQDSALSNYGGGRRHRNQVIGDFHM